MKAQCERNCIQNWICQEEKQLNFKRRKWHHTHDAVRRKQNSTDTGYQEGNCPTCTLCAWSIKSHYQGNSDGPVMFSTSLLVSTPAEKQAVCFGVLAVHNCPMCHWNNTAWRHLMCSYISLIVFFRQFSFTIRLIGCVIADTRHCQTTTKAAMTEKWHFMSVLNLVAWCVVRVCLNNAMCEIHSATVCFQLVFTLQPSSQAYMLTLAMFPKQPMQMGKSQIADVQTHQSTN